MKVQKFIFNNFQVNTFLLIEDNGECVIIDPACHSESEKKQLKDYIDMNQLKLVNIITTHNHVDHILGNAFIKNTYNIPLLSHKAGDAFIRTASASGELLGFEVKETVFPDKYLEEGDIISVGNSQLKVIYTPGHADGSISLYNEKENFIVVGDVLFRDSIGRTDLPTGDYDLLNQIIKSKLFQLPDETVVYPGHGPSTTIGEEIMNNPFVKF